MGRMKKKGESGAATNYISRTRAVRKLQLSLADFRRLCILKGIYPREPKSRKKVSGGSSAPRTYYYIKDIKYLAHEPVLDQFRQMKVFLRKLKKAVSKNEEDAAKRIEAAKPEIKVDHIVKERYPSFIDALRELDDALCMLYLFRQLPQSSKIQGDVVKKCQRLCNELEMYIINTRGLRKTFLSIKGIYYQAELHGQTITWITPYKFSTEIPDDVDFRVMRTFVQFYTTLVGFVNFRLFSSLNFKYPPSIDSGKEKTGSGVSALVIEKKDAQNDDSEGFSKQEEKELEKVMMKRIKTLKTANMMDDGGEEEEEDENAASAKTDDKLDAFPKQMEGGEQTVRDTAPENNEDALHDFTHMFDGMVFFLSREVPRYSLEFVIRSFGGNVSWESAGGVKGGQYTSTDKAITHYVIDRPMNADKQTMDRHYVQPQWVYDCVNARKVVATAPYVPGAALPPHLSPFVDPENDTYVPPSAEEIDAAESEDEEQLNDEEVYRKELESEAQGEYAAPLKENKDKKAKKRKTVEAEEEEEELEMRKMMMPKKVKRLHSRIMYTKAKKEEEASKLAQKRKAVRESKKSKSNPETEKKSNKKKKVSKGQKKSSA